MRASDTGKVAGERASSKNKILNNFLVQIHGQKRIALLDRKATLDVVPISLAQKIGVLAKLIKKRATLASGDRVKYKGVLIYFLVFFGHLNTGMKFLAVE